MHKLVSDVQLRRWWRCCRMGTTSGKGYWHRPI